MANKAISELPQAQNVNNQDLFVLEQSGIAKKLTAETFITEQGIIDALAEALDGHGGISSVTLSSVSGRIRTYLITFTDETTTTFQVYDGTSIDRIVKTSTAGLTDTYTVFMNDGSTTFFQVTNGSKGDTGYPTDEQVATAVNTWLDNNVTPGTGAVLDRTLTMSNAAAPADLVGDLKSAILDEITPSEFWAEGYWAVSNGEFVDSYTWACSINRLSDEVKRVAISDQSYALLLAAYKKNGEYVGTWFGSSFTKTYDSTYIVHEYELDYFREHYSEYDFRINVHAVSGSFNFATVIADTVLEINSVKSIKNTVENIYGDICQPYLWTNGSISSRGYNTVDVNYPNRVSTAVYLRFIIPVTIIPKSGYVFSVTTYDADKAKELQFAEWSSSPFTFTNANKLYKVNIKASAGTAITPNNIADYIASYPLHSNITWSRMLSEYANIKAVNHRGYNWLAPENTLPAYKMSAECGYKFVETDVLFTSDGVPVLMHDATINRTCCNASDGSAISGDVQISDITYAALIANYDACTPAQWATWKGVKVPTLREFIRCCKMYNLHPWIELKNERTYTQAEINLVTSIINETGMRDNVSFISFSYDALALVVNVWDDVEIGLNGSVSDAIALRTGKNRVFMIYHYGANVPSEATDAGFAICFYTVDYESELSRITNYAYDSVLTNVLLQSQVSDISQNKIG